MNFLYITPLMLYYSFFIIEQLLLLLCAMRFIDAISSRDTFSFLFFLNTYAETQLSIPDFFSAKRNQSYFLRVHAHFFSNARVYIRIYVSLRIAMAKITRSLDIIIIIGAFFSL